MARWSNAGLYQRSRESYGDTVCLFAVALCLNLTRKLRKRCMRTDTLDFQRLSDAKVMPTTSYSTVNNTPSTCGVCTNVQVRHPRLSPIPINPKGFYYDLPISGGRCFRNADPASLSILPKSRFQYNRTSEATFDGISRPRGLLTQVFL